MSRRHNTTLQQALPAMQIAIVQVVTILGLVFTQGCAPAELKELDSTQYEVVRKTLTAPRDFAFQRDLTDVPYLAQALEEKSTRVRVNAARDLAAMGRDASPARAAIERCATDSASAVRSFCKKALSNIGGTQQAMPAQGQQEQKVTIATQAAIPVPASAAAPQPPAAAEAPKRKPSSDKQVNMAVANQIAENALRQVARKRLESSEPATVSSWISAQNYLRERLVNGTPREQEIAAETLRHQSAYLDEALATLRQSLNHPDPKIRSRVILALGESRDSGSIPTLSQLLGDESVKSDAVWALEQIGTPEATKSLQRAGISSIAASKAPAVRTRPSFSARQVRDTCLVKVREARANPEDLYIEECVRRAAEYY